MELAAVEIGRPDLELFTFRELIELQIERRREAWDHTAAIIISIAATVGKSLSLDDVNPYRERPRGAKLTGERIRGMKSLFKA